MESQRYNLTPAQSLTAHNDPKKHTYPLPYFGAFPNRVGAFTVSVLCHFIALSTFLFSGNRQKLAISARMESDSLGDYLRQTSCVLYLAVDPFIPLRGKPFDGLDEFNARLDHTGVPAVWVTSRTRLQMDDPRRKNGHTHPFIGEGGCAVYLPKIIFT